MLLIAYGTRPEYIKLKPVIEKLTIPYKVLFTGQHADIVPQDIADIEIKTHSHHINRLDCIVLNVLSTPGIWEGTDAVMVQGDTTSAFAVALAAFHRNIPIYHLEAGLTTGNMKDPYPEEFNRTTIDSICDVGFLIIGKPYSAPLPSFGVVISGQTSLDRLDGMKTSYGEDVICTLHRREKRGEIKEWFSAINHLALRYSYLNFVLPLHPSIKNNYSTILTNVNVCNPMSLDVFTEKLANARFVITDSGGVQEEACFLQKRAFICRQCTERVEDIGINSVLCGKPSELVESFDLYIDDYKLDNDCPYWFGNASDIVARTLNEDLQ